MQLTNDSQPEAPDSIAWPWGFSDNEPRVLHTMVRVKDMDRSLRFYMDGLGMKVLNRYNFSPLSSVYLGFSDFRSAAIELECNAEAHEPYLPGSGFGHLSLGFPDVMPVFTKLEAMAAKIILPPMQFYLNGPIIFMVEDPDGYALELVQTRRG